MSYCLIVGRKIFVQYNMDLQKYRIFCHVMLTVHCLKSLSFFMSKWSTRCSWNKLLSLMENDGEWWVGSYCLISIIIFSLRKFSSGLSIRAVTHNTCYGQACSMGSRCYGWTGIWLTYLMTAVPFKAQPVQYWSCSITKQVKWENHFQLLKTVNDKLYQCEPISIVKLKLVKNQGGKILTKLC